MGAKRRGGGKGISGEGDCHNGKEELRVSDKGSKR